MPIGNIRATNVSRLLPDMIVPARPLVGAPYYEMGHAFRLATHSDNSSWPKLPELPCMRESVPADIGVGQWDFYCLHPTLTVSVTDAIYHRNHWVDVNGHRQFKVRLVLSGRLVDSMGRTLARAGQGHLHVGGGSCNAGYAIAAGLETKLVVLHGTYETVADLLELDLEALPVPFDRLFAGEDVRFDGDFVMSPELMRAAKQIVDGPRTLPRATRASYIRALALQVLATLVSAPLSIEPEPGERSRLRRRDLQRIDEARDYLEAGLPNPPRIASLARLVGINQTKLKAGFKERFAETIYDYISRRRMERAAELLAAEEQSVSQIAYAVGYGHPANFTSAFKRHYGMVPREWRRASRVPAERNSNPSA